MLWLSLFFIFFLDLTHKISSFNVLCYTCRSRASLGDCHDPFRWNSSSIANLRGVETTLCPSGWCSKLIEGGPDDPIRATGRNCLSRPPTDNIERCSDIFLEKKKESMFMCVCKGNLCNSSIPLSSSFTLLILLYIIIQLFC